MTKNNSIYIFSQTYIDRKLKKKKKRIDNKEKKKGNAVFEQLSKYDEKCQEGIFL